VAIADDRFTGAAPQKAAELVAEEIRSGIAEGRLAPGHRLPPQPELAARFGVSAPTLREALRILETDGLVSVRRGVKGGTIINAPNLAAMSRQLRIYLQMKAATVGDAYETRIALEPPAVGLLASRMTNDIAAELREAIEDLRSSLDDPSAVAAAAARFPTLLLERCGNEIFAALGGVTADVLERHIATAVHAARPDRDLRKLAETDIRRQLKLLDLLVAGDGVGAERHWRRTLQRQLEFLEEEGGADLPLELG